MAPRIELTPPFRDAPFAVGDALAAGMSAARLGASDLARPHWGVRSDRPVECHADLARGFLPRMRPWQAFGGITAALLWGLPVPPRLSSPRRIVVVVPADRHIPTGAAVRGLRLREDLWRRQFLGGVPVLPPVLTWLTLARICSADELLVTAEAMLTSADDYPGPVFARPLLRPEELVAFTDSLRNVTGASMLRAVARRARCGVESPMETELRTRIVAAGFPEPAINVTITDGARTVARGDLVYERERVTVEYEGAGHFESAATVQRDLDRWRELEALGWRVVRVTAADLRASEPGYLEHLARLVPPAPTHRAGVRGHGRGRTHRAAQQ